MADVPQPLIQPANTYAHVFVCCLYVSPASVTKQEVIDAVYQQTGRKVAESDLEVPEIKALGTFECSVKLVRMLLSAWLGSNSYAQLCSAAGPAELDHASTSLAARMGLCQRMDWLCLNSTGQLVCVMLILPVLAQLLPQLGCRCWAA